MDITKITDVRELKAMAFDCLQTIEIQQNNLRLIQQRIAQLEESTKDKK
jgi:arginine utilization protein RocB